MNLKSPHLVTIFDLKYGNDGRPWVIMEYVNGPSLRQLLDDAPSGLGTQKAAFFLREIAKGLTYLHDCGIVHRDLKPANIFYENGYVKIGDYGLSKVISTSQHSGQTVTVGTVHYMAPEIGAGNYDRGIDIYALGAMLFEMLTGQVPFFGSSTAEVLMKHLSNEPDVSAIEEPFKTVIGKAIAKNPAELYQSVQGMVEAVFGSEHIRNSVSVFSPDSLTMVAGHAAQKVSPSGNGSFSPSDAPAPAAPSWQCDRWGRMAGVMGRGEGMQWKLQWNMGDPRRLRRRWVLALVAALAVGLPCGKLVFIHARRQRLMAHPTAPKMVLPPPIPRPPGKPPSSLEVILDVDGIGGFRADDLAKQVVLQRRDPHLICRIDQNSNELVPTAHVKLAPTGPVIAKEA
jgi:hypothetical protein